MHRWWYSPQKKNIYKQWGKNVLLRKLNFFGVCKGDAQSLQNILLMILLFRLVSIFISSFCYTMLIWSYFGNGSFYRREKEREREREVVAPAISQEQVTAYFCSLVTEYLNGKLSKRLIRPDVTSLESTFDDLNLLCGKRDFAILTKSCLRGEKRLRFSKLQPALKTKISLWIR